MQNMSFICLPKLKGLPCVRLGEGGGGIEPIYILKLREMLKCHFKCFKTFRAFRAFRYVIAASDYSSTKWPKLKVV